MCILEARHLSPERCERSSFLLHKSRMESKLMLSGVRGVSGGEGEVVGWWGVGVGTWLNHMQQF